MIGDTPNDIPCTTNAITVQGISYSDPYFSSFNLKYRMALRAPKNVNKSDYAFKSSVCNVHDDDEHCEMQLINEKSAHKYMICKTIPRMNADAKSARTRHDNKISDVNEVKSEASIGRVFANGQLTFDALLKLTEDEARLAKGLKAADVDSWGVPRLLRLRGGGESSLNAASGWGSPPTSNNNGESDEPTLSWQL